MQRNSKRRAKKTVAIKQELQELQESDDDRTLHQMRSPLTFRPCTMEELFIQCVRQYPCLWDTQLPSYKNFELKDAAWREISKKTMIQSAAAAKTKWKYLRDTHREALKKMAKKSKNGKTPSTKTWKYMRHMEFLLPHMNSDILVTPSLILDYTTATENQKAIEDYGEIVDSSEKSTQSEPERNPLKCFFDSMYESTKQMPEHYQRLVKKKLFQTVMEAEDVIANNSFIAFNSNYPDSSSTPNASTRNTRLVSDPPSVYQRNASDAESDEPITGP